ncbi:MAG: hypothetical protein GY722_14515 [bacterium]|nr:hypothetical protein [bacterium]
MKPHEPSENGRDATGRFVPGNKVAAGRSMPHARRVARLRAELLRAVRPEDIRAVVEALVREAKQGNVQAARELLQRALGPAEAIDVAARLEAVEEQLRAARERSGS